MRPLKMIKIECVYVEWYETRPNGDGFDMFYKCHLKTEVRAKFQKDMDELMFEYDLPPFQLPEVIIVKKYITAVGAQFTKNGKRVYVTRLREIWEAISANADIVVTVSGIDEDFHPIFTLFKIKQLTP